MKFAKELDQELVPEWRAKYLNYKHGKKKLKAVAKAIRNAGKTPGSGSLKGRSPSGFPTQFTDFRAPVYNYINRPEATEQLPVRDSDTRSAHNIPIGGNGDTPSSLALPTPARDATEEDALQDNLGFGFPRREGRGMTRYGSIIGSPPTDNASFTPSQTGKAPSLRLPGPAMSAQNSNSPQQSKQVHGLGLNDGDAPINGTGESPTLDRQSTRHGSLMPRHISLFQPKRVNSMPGPTTNRQRPLAQRMFSMRHGAGHLGSPESIAMDAYKEIDVRQAEFFMFLDSELEKIEGFYKEKEDEATNRLKVLREQLHVMRDRRMEEVVQAQVAKQKHQSGISTERQNSRRSEGDPLLSADGNNGHIPWMKPVKNALAKTNAPHIGKTFRAMKELGTPAGPLAIDHDRDYSRKPQHLPPYRQAKHKLKLAMAEYYRGLELLKSYAMMNRTAFRKITKKYDKTVNARPSGRYMSEKVNRAHFVNSEIIDGHLQAVEDLYARYFERGSHKIAVSKLRAKGARAGDYTGSVFRNGLLLATGCVFGIEGLVYGSEKLFTTNDPVLVTTTSYLLQIYAGYFLMLLLALFFCLDCRLWSTSKVNYQFIFEFDTRHSLDWRQLSEIPSFFTFLLGVTLWLNFKTIGGEAMYIYWPVILIGVSVAVIFNPFPILFHRSRSWFVYSLWRLFCAFWYPVEFRDFFLGDLFCSQTYALGNIELFFCLYAQHPPWSMPTSCNSSHSRLLGFFSALPGIWRALQCLRRYKDTRNAFPHLVNCGKYLCTILYYMSLSMYRFNHGSPYKAFFIFCATINAIYCSFWDVIMDWSLLDPHAKHKFLRQTLAYKSTWPYYVAMVVDPIIRFNWIFYAIYTADVQHSTIVSFLVGLTEVCRRGMWVIFRVENEHCTNVGRFRASRDAPLPYQLASSSTTTLTSNSPQGPTAQTPQEAQLNTESPDGVVYQPSPASRSAQSTGADLSRVSSHPQRPTDALRRRKTDTHVESPVTRALNRVGTLLHTAHAQDFERKRKPELGAAPVDDDDDDDDDDDTDSDNEHPASNSGSIRRQRAYHTETPPRPAHSDDSDLERGPMNEPEARKATPDVVASDVVAVEGLSRANETLDRAKRT